MPFELPPAKSVAVNPTQQQMREWVLEYMPNVQETIYGNLNYKASVKARLAGSTFFVSETENHQNRIGRADFDKWAQIQDEHIAERDMILVEGYIGPDPTYRTGCRLFIERTQANIPAMQQQLYFDRDSDWQPEFTVIYTPSLAAPGMPDDKLILVDNDNYVTRVFGSDYFGESKMGGLRMWNHLVYGRGGLALHSGLKVFPDVNGEETSLLVLGLSGTGKTTSTFREQLGSLPVQDDFVALMPGGIVHTTEDGCFAKTYGLDPDDEPSIYGGTTRPDAWLESTHVNEDGTVDFFNDSYTRNGRATFPLANIRHRSPLHVPPASYLLLLNRNNSIIPAVAKLTREQAGAYFMLGETRGTSAGGSAEAGKSLRVPGTNPFFFDNDALQGNRLIELLDTMPDLEVYLMNTGAVGGAEDDPAASEVKIMHSSAIITGIVSDTIEWVTDPDFGYKIADSIPGFSDPELLQPRRLYERQGRTDEYERLVEQLFAARRAYLRSFPGLDEGIVEAI